MPFESSAHIEELALVQALRADPPVYAGDDPERRRVFGAALQQFEELLIAARAVGHASAPLPLFYALSQAGRAIAAARCRDDRWDFKGHGLSVDENREEVGRTVVKPNPRRDRRDAFSVVADSTGSDTLDGPVELRELWASIPQLPRVEGLGAESPSAIQLSGSPFSVAPIPHDSPAMVQAALLRIEEAALPDDQRDDAVAARLTQYPAAHPYKLIGGMTSSAQDLWLSFAVGDEEQWRTVADVGEPYLDELALYLRPSLGPSGRVPSVLMTWWAVLLALSQLARYVPGAWTAALDRDNSTFAVPIEIGLRTAQRIMPRLVLHALIDRWW